MRNTRTTVERAAKAHFLLDRVERVVKSPLGPDWIVTIQPFKIGDGPERPTGHGDPEKYRAHVSGDTVVFQKVPIVDAEPCRKAGQRQTQPTEPRSIRAPSSEMESRVTRLEGDLREAISRIRELERHAGVEYMPDSRR